MSDYLGKFVWYELMTTDADAAGAFYESVVGWKTADASHGAMRYTTFLQDEARIGGMMTLPEGAVAGGARPAWIGYVAVDDVDGCAAKFTAAGGVIHKDPADIPDIGRFCIVGDPQGAVLTLFKPLAAMASPAPQKPGPGGVAWRELMATDGKAAFDFYADLFGWTEGQVFDMGDFGPYVLFNAADGEQVGGMMSKPKTVPHPFWTFYFEVDGVKAAIARLQAQGGTLINGPHQVPTGAWIAQGLDPQGAMFSLHSPQA